ncbi:hypothetical protein CLOP_g11741 [Closterium sp. NIES-67]|nr:hypothetical protein CLOP_g11741 [Closterium sp. NIES-67]
MRRILRKIAARQEDELGDMSTLADPSVVQLLLELRDSDDCSTCCVRAARGKRGGARAGGSGSQGEPGGGARPPAGG